MDARQLQRQVDALRQGALGAEHASRCSPRTSRSRRLLTYSPNDRQNYGLATVPDDRYVTVAMHYSFSKLPEKPMMPRLADDRTGYFLTVMKDFSRDDEGELLRALREPLAAGEEGPERRGLRAGQADRLLHRPHRARQVPRRTSSRASSAGRRRSRRPASRTRSSPRIAPDDSDWDPEDVRYSTIRWITIVASRSFGAIGPSRVDPRTGEILDADILIEASIVQRRWRIYQNLMGNPVATGRRDGRRRADLWHVVAPAWPGADPTQQLQPRGRAGGRRGAGADGARRMDGMSAGQSDAMWEKFTKRDDDPHRAPRGRAHARPQAQLPLQHGDAGRQAERPRLTDRARAGGLGDGLRHAQHRLQRHPPGRVSTAAETGSCDDWMIRYGYTPSGAANVDDDYSVRGEDRGRIRAARARVLDRRGHLTVRSRSIRAPTISTSAAIRWRFASERADLDQRAVEEPADRGHRC